MSRENLELVRQVYDAVGRGDADTVVSLYDDEIEWDFSQSPLATVFNQTVYRGHDGLREFNRERFDEAWQDFEDNPMEVFEANDKVISVVSSGGHGRASGAKVALTHYGVWTIRDGKIARVDWFGSREDALDAAGVAR